MKPDRRTPYPGERASKDRIETIGSLTLAGCVLADSYSRWRPWCLTWGARPDEVTRDLPGDNLLPKPDVLATRAISIDAPPEAIWPWLAQMGSGRGGLYTNDWIENLLGLDMHSAEVVLPEFHNIEIGYAQKVGKRHRRFASRSATWVKPWFCAPTTETGCGPCPGPRRGPGRE